MSSLHRFLSASAASWIKILITIGSQVMLVPIFLGHWSVEQYGCWLIIQTIKGMVSISSQGLQNYLGYEFLKTGDRQPERMRQLFYSGVPYVLLISIIEMTVLGLLVWTGSIQRLFDPENHMDQALLSESVWALMLYSVSWLVTGAIGGLAGRAVAPYGQFPRMTWWSTWLAVAMALTSGIAVACGAGLLQMVLWLLLADFVINLPLHVDMWRMFRRYGLSPRKPDWRLGFSNALHSLMISASAVLDLSRQQGVRIFLGAIIGLGQMTMFATMRTMSNLSLQGIGTITSPLMPEIMRFLRERDSDKTNAATGFVWFFSVILLAPALLVFQVIMPHVFVAWTRGKIAFNPALFALFSVALLVFSIARPAFAILQGNNLLRVQLVISMLVSAIAVVGIVLVTGHFGVAGAASALLAAELAGTLMALYFSWKWLTENGLEFPWALFYWTCTPLVVTSIALALMVWLPQHALPVLLAGLVLNAANGVMFFRRLPPVALARIRHLLDRVLRRKTA